MNSILILGYLTAVVITVIGCVGIGILSLSLTKVIKDFEPNDILPLSLCIGIATAGVFCSTLGHLGATVVYLPTALMITSMLGWYMLFSAGQRDTKVLAIPNLASCIIFIIPIIWVLTVLKFAGGLSPTNDLFTYISISKWLQTHSFSEAAIATQTDYSITQPAMYQIMGFRMGAINILALIQSIFCKSETLKAAPISLALFASAYLSAIYLIFRWSFKTTVSASAIACIFTCPVFILCTLWSLLPQLAGFSALLCSIALLDKWSKKAVDTYQGDNGRWVIIGLSLAWLGSCYSELLPIIVLPLLTSAGSLVNSRGLKAACLSVLLVVTSALILGNIEWIRAGHALLTQKDAIVGNPMPMSAFAHIGISTGLFLESLTTYDINTIATRLAVIILLISAIFGGLKFCKPKNINSILLHSCASFIPLLIYFFFISRDPWSGKTGHTWSMFKLDQWISPFLLIFAMYGFTSLGPVNLLKTVTAIAFTLLLWFPLLLNEMRFVIDSQAAGLRQFGGITSVDEIDSLRDSLAHSGYSSAKLIRSTPATSPWPDVIYSYALQGFPLSSVWPNNDVTNAGHKTDDATGALLFCGPTLSEQWIPWRAGLVLLSTKMPHVISRGTNFPVEIQPNGATVQWQGEKSSDLIILNPLDHPIICSMHFTISTGPEYSPLSQLIIKDKSDTYISKLPLNNAAVYCIYTRAYPGETPFSISCEGSFKKIDENRYDKRQLIALVSGLKIRAINTNALAENSQSLSYNSDMNPVTSNIELMNSPSATPLPSEISLPTFSWSGSAPLGLEESPTGHSWRWLGGDNTINVDLYTLNEGTAMLSFTAHAGPCRPDGNRKLRLKINNLQRDLIASNSTSFRIKIKIPAGSSRLTLCAMDPILQVAPGGDSRPLLVGIEDLQCELTRP
jgi:hypothetical protein